MRGSGNRRATLSPAVAGRTGGEMGSWMGAGRDDAFPFDCGRGRDRCESRARTAKAQSLADGFRQGYVSGEFRLARFHRDYSL